MIQFSNIGHLTHLYEVLFQHVINAKLRNVTLLSSKMAVLLHLLHVVNLDCTQIYWEPHIAGGRWTGELTCALVCCVLMEFILYAPRQAVLNVVKW